ncbi:hypothetical protein V8G54_006496 [Vigna mungo]|uniref:Uncharacterized protein n=1 Tax=Vigna mungo TaxID=3915 RepID=A0AAQ3S847_VIGMU
MRRRSGWRRTTHNDNFYQYLKFILETKSIPTSAVKRKRQQLFSTIRTGSTTNVYTSEAKSLPLLASTLNRGIKVYVFAPIKMKPRHKDRGQIVIHGATSSNVSNDGSDDWHQQRRGAKEQQRFSLGELASRVELSEASFREEVSTLEEGGYDFGEVVGELLELLVDVGDVRGVFRGGSRAFKSIDLRFFNTNGHCLIFTPEVEVVLAAVALDKVMRAPNDGGASSTRSEIGVFPGLNEAFEEKFRIVQAQEGLYALVYPANRGRISTTG